MVVVVVVVAVAVVVAVVWTLNFVRYDYTGIRQRIPVQIIKFVKLNIGGCLIFKFTFYLQQIFKNQIFNFLTILSLWAFRSEKSL